MSQLHCCLCHILSDYLIWQRVWEQHTQLSAPFLWGDLGATARWLWGSESQQWDKVHDYCDLIPPYKQHSNPDRCGALFTEVPNISA